MTDQIEATSPAALGELLPVGADVDRWDGDGRSALWHAARRGELGGVIHLAELAGNGRSVTQPDNRGFTPLYAAAWQGNLEVVQWLAGNGGSVAQPANGGYTPLLIAAYQGHIEVVQWLAGNGGSVAQPDNGCTSLSAAVREGQLEVVQWLAGNGGSVTQPANNGLTAVAAATRNGHDGVAAFLTAASPWSAFKILVACRLADDAERALCSGRLDPCTGPTSLTELVATSVSPKDALWAGSPDVCPITRRLVHDAMGPWTPSLPLWGSQPHPGGAVVPGTGFETGTMPRQSCGCWFAASSSGRIGRYRPLTFSERLLSGHMIPAHCRRGCCRRRRREPPPKKAVIYTPYHTSSSFVDSSSPQTPVCPLKLAEAPLFTAAVRLFASVGRGATGSPTTVRETVRLSTVFVCPLCQALCSCCGCDCVSIVELGRLPIPLSRGQAARQGRSTVIRQAPHHGPCRSPFGPQRVVAGQHL